MKEQVFVSYDFTRATSSMQFLKNQGNSACLLECKNVGFLLNNEKVLLMSRRSTDRLELGGAFWGYFGKRKYLNPIF